MSRGNEHAQLLNGQRVVDDEASLSAPDQLPVATRGVFAVMFEVIILFATASVLQVAVIRDCGVWGWMFEVSDVRQLPVVSGPVGLCGRARRMVFICTVVHHVSEARRRQEV